MYPDFHNSFLGFIQDTILSGGTTIASNSAVETINGTKINAYFGNVILPDYYTGINGSDVGLERLGFNKTGAGTITAGYRFGTDRGLQGGEIVGKKVVFGAVGLFTNSNSRIINDIILNYTIQLLHTDGTLTQIYSGTMPTIGGTGSPIVASYSPKVITTTTDGVVAQAGDRIVLDLDLSVNFTGNYSGMQGGVAFGYKYTNNDGFRYPPLQISID